MRRALGKPRPQAAFDGIALCSHFQPIYSLPHQRQVGYEALLRGVASAGGLLEPFELFLALVCAAALTGQVPRRCTPGLTGLPARFMPFIPHAISLFVPGRVALAGMAAPTGNASLQAAAS